MAGALGGGCSNSGSSSSRSSIGGGGGIGGSGSSSSSSCCLPACLPACKLPTCSCSHMMQLLLVYCLQYRLVEGRDLLDELNARGGRLDEPTAAAYFLQLVGFGWLVGRWWERTSASSSLAQHPLTCA